MKYLFYKTQCDPSTKCQNKLPSDLSVEYWQPSMRSMIPPTIGFDWKQKVWGLLAPVVPGGKSYGLLLIRELITGRVVHQASIVPRFLRSSFMGKEDLQLSVHTLPDYRGLGLATYSILYILAMDKYKYRKCWYVCAECNIKSIRVAEKCEFKLHGYGVRTKPMGMRIFGRFILVEGAK